MYFFISIFYFKNFYSSLFMLFIDFLKFKKVDFLYNYILNFFCKIVLTY